MAEELEMESIKLLDKYQPLFLEQPKSRYYLITGGRGSGKSWTLSMFLLNLTYEEGHVILFTRWTLTSAFISIIPEFIDKIELMNKAEDFEITQSEIINKATGSKILFRGIKTSQGTATANLKSIAGVTTFILDESEELMDEDVFDRIDLSIRAINKPNRVILVMNPSYKSHWIYSRFVRRKSDNCTYIHTTYLDNERNLSKSFVEQAERTKRENLHRYNHLFLGEWLEDAEGMLWNRQIWATVAVKAFERWNADCIVAEKNQGGDMVESVLRSQNATARIKLVTATKGKYVRAEPIYSLYEQNKVYHIGHFPLLEAQMITFDPDKGKSPDRVDALVWGFTELLLGSKFTFSI
jgi:PBSX family phage terminase large subunit